MKIIEKLNLKDKKNIIFIILIIGIISMTVAFAALTARLNINGTANVAAVNWNVHFQNWEKETISTGTTGNTNTAVAAAINQLSMSDNTNVTKVENIGVTLNQPGDIVKYNFEITNDGSINAKLDNFTASMSTESEVIGYTVKCYESNTRTGTEITTNSVLAPNDIAYCYIEIKYNDTFNSHTPGSNQVYTQNAISTSLTASWTWTQEGNTPGAIIEPVQQTVPCENGQWINNTSWCLTNPGASLKNQKFEYWNGNEKIMSGWQTLTDLSGNSQTYYFEDGYAYVGWLTLGGNNYFLSWFDDDENGYVNCNLITDTLTEIDDQCYSIDANGVATESNSCSSNIISYETTFDGRYRYNTHLTSGWVENFNSSWNFYLRNNLNDGKYEACGKFSGSTICIEPNLWNSSNVHIENNEYVAEGYVAAKKNEFESHGASCMIASRSMKCKISADNIQCVIYKHGGVYCGDATSGGYGCDISAANETSCN